jgi:hypothetical protein
MTKWEERQAKKLRDRMLTDFLRAKTAEEKRAVIEAFAPHYFVFGTDLKTNKVRNEEEDGNTL